MRARQSISLVVSLALHAGVGAILWGSGVFQVSPRLELPEGASTLLLPASVAKESGPPVVAPEPVPQALASELAEPEPQSLPVQAEAEPPSPQLPTSAPPELEQASRSHEEPAMAEAAANESPEARLVIESTARELATSAMAAFSEARRTWSAALDKAAAMNAARRAATPAPAKPAAAGPVGVSRGPSVLSGNVPPLYPEEARRRHQQGAALIHVVIEVDGAVSNATLDTTSGFDLLDQAALVAARQWRFSPALRHGQPVRSEANVPVIFTLRD